jgi:hypothetical protein
MIRFGGALARQLDFGDSWTSIVRPTLTLAPRPRRVRPAERPAKYAELAHRRRQAQIKARHLLDLV